MRLTHEFEEIHGFLLTSKRIGCCMIEVIVADSPLVYMRANLDAKIVGDVNNGVIAWPDIMVFGVSFCECLFCV